MELLEFLVTTLSNSDKVWAIEELAEIYVRVQRQTNQDSIDFSSQVAQTERLITRIVKQYNDRYEKDGTKTPFVIKGTSNNLLTKTSAIENLKESLNPLEENPHSFADRVGHEILRRMGCAEEKIRLTQKSRDAGIDYWGE